jgi:methylated-DNA-[protein]-cysteine S-methyltransferase
MELALYQSTIDSPVGPLRILSTPEGLAAVLFGRGSHRTSDSWVRRRFPGVEPVPAGKTHRLFDRQIHEYFEGRRRIFDLSFDLRGTEFQTKVWTVVARIPYGQTVSYGEIAHLIGKPKAVRAVGAANGANPISIIIPCHRVIGADGSLTGYGGGLKNKRWLLAHEGVLRVGPVQMSLFRGRSRHVK